MMADDFDPIAEGAIPWNPATMGGAPAGATSPQSGRLPGGGLAGGNIPGFEEAIKAQTDQQKAMTTRAGTFAADMYPLFQAKQALAVAPTGKGSEVPYEISSKLSTFMNPWLQRNIQYFGLPGALAKSVVMTPEETAAYAEADKYLTQVGLTVPGATRSNEGGATAAAASPSVHIPKPAAQLVLQNMIALRRMEHDQTLQWQQSGQPISKLNDFVADFQAKADPRVYVWDQMPATKQQQILGSMTPIQQAAFRAKVHAADNRGLYNNFGVAP